MIVNSNWWTEITDGRMCKAGPPTNNNVNEVFSLNTEFGLINVTGESWSLGKAAHRTEMVLSLFLTILIGVAIYKLRKKCL